MTAAVRALTYSRVLEGTGDALHGPIHRSVYDSRLPSDAHGGLAGAYCESIYHSFQECARAFAERPCLGVQPLVDGAVAGPFAWQTYAEIAARIAHAAAGMVHLELLPRVTTERRRMVAIYMKNSIEWIVAEQAAYAMGAVVVALYDSLGADSTEYILNQTELPTVVCTLTELRKLVALGTACPHVRNVILCGAGLGDDEGVASSAATVGLRVFRLEELEAEGRKHPHPPEPPREEDLATIMYTSGTTGDPKGVMISHRAFLVQGQATADFCADFGITFGPGTTYLSYLPLAHIFERGTLVSIFRFGGRVGISQGNPLKIVDDLRALRPTVFCSVPRLLNRVHDLILGRVRQAPPLRRWLFLRALGTKLDNLRQGRTRHAVWDRVIFRRIAASIGLDRCEAIFSGSAPLSPDVLSFWRVAFPAIFVEGYGQTETASGITVSHAKDLSAGYVGGPSTSAEIRLESVPEMGYLVTDREHAHGDERLPCVGRGEICVRGPMLFSGYYKLPDKTAEAIDADGWLHTGDVGLWSPLGQLKIIDRKKNIFKLSQGEYVAPEKIENILQLCSSVAQIFVTGDSFHSHLVAVVVPDEAVLKQLAAAQGISVATSLRELCDQPALVQLVQKQLDEQSVKGKLAGFERVRRIYLHHELFSIDNDLLTPSFKLKRADAQRFFKKQIDRMYELSGDVVAGKNITQQ